MELETGGQPLDLATTLTSGQLFHWKKEDGWFSGVISGCFIKIRQHPDGTIEFRSSQPEPSAQYLLHRYFRLDDDIETIYAEISRDTVVARLVEQYRGLRILRHEPWECLVAYILSVRSPIERTRRNSETLSEHLGGPVALDGEIKGAFPTPRQIVQAGEARLMELLVGFDSYADRVFRAASEVEQGLLDLDALKRVSYQEAIRRLMRCSGIRDKVANCIALFSLDHLDAFPIDTHIETALLKSYRPDMRPATGRRLRDYELRKLMVWSRGHFGPYAGYAGQFLFQDQRMQQRRR